MSRVAFVKLAALLVHLSVLAFDRVAWAESAPPISRKMFLQSVEVHPCIPTSPTAVRLRFNAEIPRDILALRNLKYEDIPSYAEVESWNPTEFNVRATKNALKVLARFDMAVMLGISVSCVPADKGMRHVLVGKLTDLKIMDTILSCPKEQAAQVDERRVCHVGGDVFDAVSVASVEFDGFDGFRAAARELLAQLLHLPEVQFGSTEAVYDPYDEINLPFFVRRNDGTERDYNGPPAEKRSYRLAQDVVELPKDLVEVVCKAPDEHWKQIRCGAGDTAERCDPADPIQFTTRTLIHREIAPSQGTNGEHGGDRISFRAPPHAQDYLVRAEVIAAEKTGEIRSVPIYRCLHVRDRTLYLGLMVRVGVPYDLAHLTTARARDPVYPAAGLLPLALGVDLEVSDHISGRASSFLPSWGLVGYLGFTHIVGSYPCPNHSFTDCEGLPGHLVHISYSDTFELRGGTFLDLFRVGHFGSRLVSSLGLGIERLVSVPALTLDGVRGVFLGGVGGALTLSGVSRALGNQSWLDDIALGAFLQTRLRLAGAAVPGPGFVNAPGVPDGVEMISFFLEYSASKWR